MRIGKLDNATLERLILSKFPKTREEVFEAPRVGMDCARVSLPSGIAVLSTDPITAANKRIGALTVHINCNDAATAGAEPIGLLVTLLAPPCVTEQTLSDIAEDIERAAKSINVDIIGGHTEITDSVNKLITSSTVIASPVGEPLENRICVGDDIVMTKTAGLEGSAVLAFDHESALKKLGVSDEELSTARDMANSISVVKEGLFAARHGARLMHDVTEGGALGALWEMAYAAGVGLRVDVDAIPVESATACICSAVNIDVYRLLSSGSMLIACENGASMVSGLKDIGIQATVIAKAVGKENGVTDCFDNTIEPPESDELYKVAL